MLYLDNCATTPVDPVVAQTVARVMVERFGNPSSIHQAGRHAARTLADARRSLATSIGANSSEIVLTSSGTEANNIVIGGLIAFAARQDTPIHIITTAAEHASVRQRLAWETRRLPDRLHVTELLIDRYGRITEAELISAIRPGETRLISILHANNETGILQDLELLKKVRLANPRVLLHLDWIQSFLKIPIDVSTYPVDFLTVAAHKVHGPRGAGFVYVRRGTENQLEPLTFGGAQEKYRRAGTEDVASVAGFAAAVQIAPTPDELYAQLWSLERAFFNTLIAEGTRFYLNAPQSADLINSYEFQTEPSVREKLRMPGVFNIAFPGISNKEDLLIALDLDGVMVSSSSACHSGVVADSHVLAAMGVPEPRRAASIRVGLSRMLTETEVAEAARRVSRAALRIASSAL